MNNNMFDKHAGDSNHLKADQNKQVLLFETTASVFICLACAR
jgi:hypothetical protein